MGEVDKRDKREAADYVDGNVICDVLWIISSYKVNKYSRRLAFVLQLDFVRAFS